MRLPQGMTVKALSIDENKINYSIQVDDNYIINLLKEERSRLRASIPNIKHTVRQKQAIKKEKRLDYVIGRMIFFRENFEQASKRARQEVKNGQL